MRCALRHSPISPLLRILRGKACIKASEASGDNAPKDSESIKVMLVITKWAVRTTNYKSVDANIAPLFRRHSKCKAAFGMDNGNVKAQIYTPSPLASPF